MRRPAGDDRPFPEQDYLVFPVENMYDRIVRPDRDRSVSLTKCKGQSVANNKRQAWWIINNENQSPCDTEGKSVNMDKNFSL